MIARGTDDSAALNIQYSPPWAIVVYSPSTLILSPLEKAALAIFWILSLLAFLKIARSLTRFMRCSVMIGFVYSIQILLIIKPLISFVVNGSKNTNTNQK